MHTLKIPYTIKYCWSVLLVSILFLVSSNLNGQTKSSHKKGRKVVVVSKPSARYVHTPNRGKRVAVVPNGAKTLKWKTKKYFFNNGAFYTSSGKEYMVVSPPVGIRVKALPLGFIRIKRQKRSLFYFNGIYYQTTGNEEYEVINPPIGAQVDALPLDSEQVLIDEKTYYKTEDILYKAVIGETGEILYEVVDI